MNNETYFVKLSGKANIPTPLSIGHNFKLEADCSVVSEQRSDNEDSTYNVTYKMLPVTVTITKDNGEVVRAKDLRRNSEKFRKYCWKVWSDSPAAIYDFDSVYSEVINEAMSQMPSIMEEAIKRLER